MTEAWRLLTTWDGQPGFNMALDEALLLHGGARPTLRFYTWKPAALSLGYFQKVNDVPAAKRADVCVRRLTGGGAIHHAEELTFSIAAPLDHPLYRGEVKHSYERVHHALAVAFGGLGIEVDLAGERALSSDRKGSGMCFHRSTPLDLAWGARKVVGSAQRRSKGRVLHHGSIKLGKSPLEPGVAVLREHAPDLHAADLADRIRTCFESLLALRCIAGQIEPAESDHIRERAAFFTSREFVNAR
jgi:lipoate-protein ligase A